MPSNVDLFYNRWQQEFVAPIDFWESGELVNKARRSLSDLGLSIKEQDRLTGTDHSDIVFDPRVESDLEDIIDAIL